MTTRLGFVFLTSAISFACVDEEDASPAPTVDSDVTTGMGDKSIVDSGVMLDATGAVDATVADTAAPLFTAKSSCALPAELADNSANVIPDYPVLASDPEGRAVLAYADLLLNSTKRTMRARLFDGVAWGSLATLGDTADTARSRNVAIDSGGAALVGYALVGGTEGARYHYSGGTWQDAGNVEMSSNEAALLGFISPTRPLSLAIGIGAPSYAIRDGSWTTMKSLLVESANTTAVEIGRTTKGAFVAWADIDNALHAHYFSDKAAVPPSVTLAAANTVGIIGQVALVPLPDEQTLVAWQRYTAGPTRELMVSTLSRSDDKTVFSPAVAIASGQEFTKLQGISDASGNVTLSFTNETGTRAIRRVGAVWSAPVLLGKMGSLENRQLAIDTAGHVTVLLRAEDGGLFHRRIARGADVWTPAHRINTPQFPANTGGGYFAIGVNAAGDPFAVWSAKPVDRTVLVWSTCR
jgi:hypothetical protein